MNYEIKALIFDIFGVLFEKDHNSNIVPIKEGLDLLEACTKEQGHHKKILLYALSNASNGTIQKLTEQYPDIFASFYGITTSEDATCKKPNPEIYQFFLRQHQLKPHSCVFIDDSYENVKTANNLGFLGIHHVEPQKSRRELERFKVLSTQMKNA